MTIRRFINGFIIAVLCICPSGCGVRTERREAVRIMTYNLHHCEGEDGIYDVGRIARFMREIDADIILCQEVDRGYSDRSRMEDQPEMLRSILGFHSFYGPNIGGTYGNLILSRYPIESAENVPLPNPENKEPRGVIVSTVDIGGRRFSVLDTHLCAFSEINREEQVRFLKKLVRGLEHPVIFGADFNCTPTGQLKPLLDGGVLVSSRRTVLGLEEGIDDILVPESMAEHVVDGGIVGKIFSDHPAYWIDLDTGIPEE